PGADLKRLEEATADMFKRVWGIRMGQIKDLAEGEIRYFVREYRDIVYEMPFQFPADMLFVIRAVGILSGMATNLDPNFDPWAETIPFAERLAREEVQRSWREWLEEVVTVGQTVFRLPHSLDDVLAQARRGDLTVQTSLAPDLRRRLEKLEASVDRLGWMTAAGSMLVAGAVLYAADAALPAGGLFGLSALLFLWGLSRR
ncbi:MAG: hypothetical protein D6784_02455, partial [Chloroflexi bacterium]